MVDVSIIIVSYNTKKLTLQAVESAIGVDKSIKKEIIVVDNGSDDGSVETLRKLKTDNKIKFIKNLSNLGFSKANNQGIKIAKGKYIFLLNSDTKVKEEALNSLVKFAQITPDAGVVAAKLLNPDGSIQASCFRFPTLKNAILEYWFGKKGLFDKYAPYGKKPTTVDASVAAAFLITPKALADVGRLDERYFFYMEDIDYCRQVWRSGLKVYYLPSAEVYHYHGASGKHLADDVNQWRRLIPSSKIYHGVFKHYLLTLILWMGQKWQKFLRS